MLEAFGTPTAPSRIATAIDDSATPALAASTTRPTRRIRARATEGSYASRVLKLDAPHAILLTGPFGVGKSSLAAEIAVRRD